MGGEQAGNVLTQIRVDNLKGKNWSTSQQQEFKQEIVEQYERQGQPYYSSARLWDDGVIDPTDTRQVLALALSAAYNAPSQSTRFGIFRM